MPVRPVRVLALVVSLALAAVLAPVPTTAPAAAAPGTVVGVGSGMCLDVTGNVRTSRTPVNQFRCNGQPNQAWELTAAGELRVNGSMCLDVRGAAVTSPAVAQIYPCHGRDNQKWRVGTDGTIRGVQSGLCLDVERASTADSAPVIMWTCHGGANQQWRVGTAATGPDTAAPTPPANPRVSDLRCDSTRFTWDASSDDIGVTSYDVYHDGQKMTSVDARTTSTVLEVVPGVRWGLYVNARDAAGNISQASATVSIEVPQCAPDSTPPSTPTGVVGTATGTSVGLRWNASTDDVGVRSYEVLRDGTKVGSVPGVDGAPPATTFTDSGLEASTEYTYTVRALDAQDNASPSSPGTSVTTGSGCAEPVCGARQVTTDTDIPWGLATLPDGDVLYTRRDAHDVVRLDPDTGAKTTVGTVPGAVSTDGEGGLLGLAVAPSFGTDRWVYLMHTTAADNRVVRIQLVGDRLDTSTTDVLVQGIGRNKYHNGGRLRFGPDGKLYASTGDAQVEENAQRTASLDGKILRLNPDGSVPSDNPFGNYVWSYGHRNPQGIAFDAQGRLWQQEFGNSVMDETNLIVKGGNYGWPACEGTSGDCGRTGFIAPKATYSTAAASCSGLTVVRDALYVACGRGARLYRHVIDGDGLTDQRTYFSGTYGRLRTVEPAADGGLWLTTTTAGDKDSIAGNSDEKVLHVDLGP